MSDASKSNLAAGGAACGAAGLSGLAAAMGFCCYGPLAVTLVGVTGAAWFSRFEPYRPIVLILAAALLAWGFWRVYRQPQRGLGIQIVLWLSLLLLLGSLFLPELAAASVALVRQESDMRRRTLLISFAAAGAASACGEAIDNAAMDGPPVAVETLDDDLTALKSAFNVSPDSVRLVFIVGPSYGPCLRGLMELNQALGADLLSHERLKVLVVHVPTLGAEAHHVERAAGLMRGSSVTHYWDPSGRSGDAVQQALGIQEYAWGVWLTYPPGPIWTEPAPPEPATWSHQLGGLRVGTRLNADAFAADVRTHVEQLV